MCIRDRPEGQQPSMIDLWEAQQQLKRPDTRSGKIRALQESAALFSFLQANGIQSMQQLHEKIADMNSRYYDLRGKIVKAERRITTLTERGEMWEQYNQYKSIHKQDVYKRQGPIRWESWPASLPFPRPSGKHSGNGHRRGRSVPSLSLSLSQIGRAHV